MPKKLSDIKNLVTDRVRDANFSSDNENQILRAINSGLDQMNNGEIGDDFLNQFQVGFDFLELL